MILIFFLSVISVVSLHVHADNSNPNEIKNRNQEGPVADGEEESGDKAVLESPDNDLSSVQIKIREEYVEIIPIKEEIQPAEEKKPFAGGYELPPGLGILSVAVFMVLLILAGAFYLTFMTCKIYWTEGQKRHFLGFVGIKRKDEETYLKIREEMLECSPAVEFQIVFPLWFSGVHRYETVHILMGGEIKNAYVEKKLICRMGLHRMS